MPTGDALEVVNRGPFPVLKNAAAACRLYIDAIQGQLRSQARPWIGGRLRQLPLHFTGTPI